MKLIDSETLHNCFESGGLYTGHEILGIIENAEVYDTTPRAYGVWKRIEINTRRGGTEVSYICSRCKTTSWTAPPGKFCPDCGAENKKERKKRKKEKL